MRRRWPRVQRESIVALRHGFGRPFQRRDGSVVFRGRIAIGARGTRGVDGALCLIHFTLRRITARGSKQARREQHDGTQTLKQTRHQREYTLPIRT